ncbi:transposase [Patescibacteria group bacterium]|nr:transposase [Patescibacteria group bacterium]MBU1256780.1 transposase [Patescibacteria group bacterium]MBU1457405.1 transposase [Patescibacteria group bacterium]
MPSRKTPLFTGGIYHVFNKGIDGRKTFSDKTDYERAVRCIDFYHFSDRFCKLSRFLTLTTKKQQQIFEQTQEKLVEIYCYCLMPNHFHLLIKQLADGGVSKYLSDFQNSYTRYHNKRQERTGQLFMNQFKAVRVTTDEQLMHVSRYIHLNPHTGSVVNSLKELRLYPWSSLKEYLKIDGGFCKKEVIVSPPFNEHSYWKFVGDQADYQKQLKEIKRLILE